MSPPGILPSPLRDKVGCSDHDRFRGYFPVHFIPAYNLPVYASQWPLPDTTQDSVRGCWLSFAAVAIPGDWVTRAFKAQPARIRTSPIKASGLYGAFFVNGEHHFFRALFGHSFVRPAPRAFFRPDRILAVAVARSEGQGRRFFSAAEGLSLTNASTAANCPYRVVCHAMIRGEPAIGRDQSREPRLYSVEPVWGCRP
jgi:hypothetical protein